MSKEKAIEKIQYAKMQVASVYACSVIFDEKTKVIEGRQKELEKAIVNLHDAIKELGGLIMTREKVKEMLPILQAFSEGKVIECRTKPSALSKSWQDMNEWTEMKEIEFWSNIEYRIKQQSEARFRPFNTEEECWQEIRKHEPFIKYKVIESSKDVYLIIQRIKTDGIETDVERLDFETAFEWFTFADGTPFGVKEE